MSELVFKAEDFEGAILGEERNLICAHIGPDSLGYRSYSRIAEIANAKVAPLVEENSALRNQSSIFEGRLREATKAGTPYWRERDTQNALIVEVDRLRAEVETLKSHIEAPSRRTVEVYNENRRLRGLLGKCRPLLETLPRIENAFYEFDHEAISDTQRVSILAEVFGEHLGDRARAVLAELDAAKVLP